MGLDTYVYKVVKVTAEEAQKINDSEYNEGIATPLRGARLFNIDENPELKRFEAFANTINIEQYDIEKIYSTYNFKDGDLIGQSSDWEDFDTPNEKYFFLWELKDGHTLKIEEKTLPRITVSTRVVAFVEVSYQRKGANAAFYNDDIWGGDFVVDIATLTEHWNKYFSGDVKKEKEELEPGMLTGLGVEYENSAEENRNNFKKNILDKFIDGETIVGYL